MDKYKIFGLHCQECADDLKESLTRIENGDKIKLDYKNKLIYLPEDLNLDQFNKQTFGIQKTIHRRSR
ncbi:heavy-metal-associated domain-containing protein [uncultured Helcococcus sp.]|uniref:heavy-metal-associated domain-containing protein n=1 Tax=uncultured Helcococcus sp. TaxID=1072508 RepID=UPI002601895F|nr:heavy-metal-associated domain-containing protein [uncultured Helcococcus sp.]